MKHRLFPITVFFLCTSCTNSYLTIDRQFLSPATLASSFVKSPDPLSAHPPKGERLWVQWSVPKMHLEEGTKLLLWVIYKDYTEEKIAHPIRSSQGHWFFQIEDKDLAQKKGILTYKVELINPQGKVISSYKHQMWFELLPLGA